MTKRLALTIIFGALTLGACTPHIPNGSRGVTGGVGTACQGDAHGIVCK